MDGMRIAQALLLGLVEGLTEFIPVSSTGHILLLGHFLGFHSPGKTFEVLIQFGAILAILIVYFRRLLTMALRMPTDPVARRFALGVVLAFLPAAFIGALAHGFIKSVLFETPVVICVALVVGGFILLLVDGLDLRFRYHDGMRLPVLTCLAIGFCQCLALIPGVSRSGSSIVGAMLLGVDKRAAAEFSFFLAIPTMSGAFVYDLYKNRDLLSFDEGVVIAVGFVAAFLSALLVVRTLLNFVSRRGYAPFAWWRIVVGSLGLVALLVFG
jgi:undecaprenyl-diphosphatase